MTRSALVCVAVLAVATTTLEATPSRYKKWLNEDVVYLITAGERVEFLKLKTDEQRDRFIERFWLDRDPPPGAPQHDTQAEHYRRIAFANEHFATTSGKPGWKTARGYIYIIWGPPDEITPYSNGTQYMPWPFEHWHYRHVEGFSEDIHFLFEDPGRKGDYVLGANWLPLQYFNSGPAIRVATRVEEQNLVTRIEPIYPVLAKWAHVQGTVRLSVVIGKDGRVLKIKRVSGPRSLAGAARDAVRQWVYKPILLNWEAVEVHTTVDVNFSLPAK